jgi:hypothetical protein
MKAMGFKDRGHSKFCFKNYEEEESDSEDEELRKPKAAKKYYDGPITFKDNFFGLGYTPAPNELSKKYQ